MAANGGELVGGTTLFRTYAVTDAQELQGGWLDPASGSASFPIRKPGCGPGYPAGRTTGAACGTH
jgi:hypothetical protein